jgi:hypothetical protein
MFKSALGEGVALATGRGRLRKFSQLRLGACPTAPSVIGEALRHWRSPEPFTERNQ